MSKGIIIGLGIVGAGAFLMWSANKAKADPNAPGRNEVVLSNGTVVIVKGFTELYKGPGDKPTPESDAVLAALPQPVLLALKELEEKGEAANGAWFNPSVQVTVPEKGKFLVLYDDDFNLRIYGADLNVATVFKNA